MLGSAVRGGCGCEEKGYSVRLRCTKREAERGPITGLAVLPNLSFAAKGYSLVGSRYPLLILFTLSLSLCERNWYRVFARVPDSVYIHPSLLGAALVAFGTFSDNLARTNTGGAACEGAFCCG